MARWVGLLQVAAKSSSGSSDFPLAAFSRSSRQRAVDSAVMMMTPPASLSAGPRLESLHVVVVRSRDSVSVTELLNRKR